jgi:hypothetical protein
MKCACLYVFLCWLFSQISLLHLSDLNVKLEAFVKAPAVVFDNGIKNF